MTLCWAQLAGRPSEAVAAYEHALSLDPSNEVARENLQATPYQGPPEMLFTSLIVQSARREAAKAGGSSPAATASNSRAGGGGGGSAGRVPSMPPGMPAGLEGIMNNPMLSSLMSNPAIMQAAQQASGVGQRCSFVLGWPLCRFWRAGWIGNNDHNV